MNWFSYRFFSPSQNLDELFPVLSGLFVLLLLLACMAGITHIWRQQARMQMTRRRFHSYAQRKELNNIEMYFTQQLAKQAKIEPCYRILSNQAFFEKAIDKAAIAKKYPEKFIEAVREKLFDRTLYENSQSGNTLDLVPGCKLIMRSRYTDEKLVHGRLVDTDQDGLIVVVGRHKGSAGNLHPSEQLSVTAQLHNRKPVYFFTEVKKVIPGPKKMLVLEHADFIASVPPQMMHRKANPLLTRVSPHITDRSRYLSTR